mmetsp:Transcript_9313/g.23969  ORF Transcript_9313/g.23969 Transcript_9313/m.23969 type:complete len:176 (+) Transcript_9313:250-777(+)
MGACLGSGRTASRRQPASEAAVLLLRDNVLRDPLVQLGAESPPEVGRSGWGAWGPCPLLALAEPAPLVIAGRRRGREDTDAVTAGMDPSIPLPLLLLERSDDPLMSLAGGSQPTEAASPVLESPEASLTSSESSTPATRVSWRRRSEYCPAAAACCPDRVGFTLAPPPAAARKES